VDTQRFRVSVRAGQGIPLLICNGIGACLEALDPLMESLRHDLLSG